MLEVVLKLKSLNIILVVAFDTFSCLIFKHPNS
jgi:hypothetical protein